ncbi:NAD(P)-dependent alcohol dehydrogenase [Nocardioides nanhaiensis]|uniref:alcohol dehydrogenase (NADP(+)) n=1 Tax=Nocardioides nanhaiensis TaxID=1476871 RepID=A0ABP8VU40_9ACTN
MTATRTTTALLKSDAAARLTPTAITRRALRDDDVQVAVSHCGICHTDLHALRGGGGPWPLVPGHEFVGEVTAVGPGVTAFAVGDPVAVGNIVDSCGTCDMCVRSQENCCREFPLLTYGGTDAEGATTLGGWSTSFVVRESFCYRRPASLDAAAVAPLMCAGVTVWVPLRTLGVGPGTRVGVAGVGGLGHLAVKLAVALGAEVTAITGTAAKVVELRSLGATRVLVTSDAPAMEQARGSLDVVVDCVPVAHELAPLLDVLDLDGTLAVVGFLGSFDVDVMDLLMGRKRLLGSGSAGRGSTQELLDFCGEHGITADVEVVPTADVEQALERLGRGDVRYRFVLDLADLRPA